MINRTIHWVTNNHFNLLFYYGFIVLGILTAFVYVTFFASKYSIPRWKAVSALTLICVPSFFMMLFIGWISSGFKTWNSLQSIRLFIVFYILILPVSKIFSIDPFKMSDFFSPCLCLFCGVSHFGCMFFGCCHGYLWKYGVYNRFLEANTFPVQPLESVVALAIALILIFSQKSKNYVIDGKSYPMMLILFGLTRFLLEFARKSKKVFLGISKLGLHALFILLVGISIYLSLQFSIPSKRISYKAISKARRKKW